MKFFLFLLFFSLSTLSFAFQLKEKFLEGSVGSYVVTEQNKTTTLLHLHTLDGERAILEEISLPSHIAKKRKINWDEWVGQKAPQHSSWIMYEIDLKNNEILECYSFHQQAFLSTDTMQSFLVILLNLDLKTLPFSERKRIGPPPSSGEPDRRKLWVPIQKTEDKKRENRNYQVVKAIWPTDESELSGKTLELYFDKQNKGFPFPYWLQIIDGSLTFHMRAIDSGTGLISPYKELPRRIPFFIGGIKKEGSSFLLKIKMPRYYQEISLFATELDGVALKAHLIPCQLKREKELVTISVEEKILQETLKNKGRYLWTVDLKGLSYPLEMDHPFHWKGT